MSIPQTMQAITATKTDDGRTVPVIHTRPLPALRPGYLLVRVAAVAINPADILCLDLLDMAAGALLGCDYAGTVVDVGTGVQRGFQKGDRVCGCTRPADPMQFENGTFAEYVAVKADLQLRIPEAMGFEDAAALGVTTLTAGRCFFDQFGIEYPVVAQDGSVDTNQQEPRQLFVYGGSTAMGTMVIQYAKLANFTVLTTSAPHNAAMVRSYGADVVVDHYSQTAATELAAVAEDNRATLGPLTLCVDNISNENSTRFCAQVLTPEGGYSQPSEMLHSTIGPFTPEIPGVKTVCTVGYSFLGEDWELFSQRHSAVLEDFEAARRFAVVAEHLLALGLVKPHPVDVRKNQGLQGVLETGLAEMRSGKVSGKKLVYTL